ncbi:MAG: hypothetical protein IKI41_01630, partial [Clostridia bacterium]|nr:hypothetical protein [Clostridia bacterium]
DAAFDKGAKSDHGEFAKQFSVTVDISKYVNDYEVGVCAKLADGTVVLLNSTAAPEKNTFIKFAGPMTEEYMFEEGDVDTNPVEVLFFDEETNYSYFFKGKNDIIDISYDEEKHCYTVVMEDAYDPYFELDFATLVSLEEIEQISADEAKVVSIGVRFNPEGRVDGTFYYQTSEYPGYSESQNIHYRYENKNDYQFIYIDLRDAENWTGDVANCRYDLLATCSGACDFEIYYIAFFKTMRGAKEFGEAWLERGGGANSGEAASENTPEPTDQPTEEATQEPATEPAAEPTTEPATEPTTEPAAEPTEKATEKPDDEAGKNGGKKGCGGTAVGILPVALLAAAASAGFVFKRKEN